MRNIAVLAAIISFAICMTNSAYADMFFPSHSCSKPYKPYQFNNEWELENFKNEVEQYKQCITEFVEEQDEAIRKHKNAAEEAIDEWNNYVNYELN
jgi:hypothetical protein